MRILSQHAFPRNEFGNLSVCLRVCFFATGSVAVFFSDSDPQEPLRTSHAQVKGDYGIATGKCSLLASITALWFVQGWLILDFGVKVRLCLSVEAKKITVL